MGLSAFLDLLCSLEMSECNGNYQRLVHSRVISYCELMSKSCEDLTLVEVKTIIDCCTAEFNDFFEAA